MPSCTAKRAIRQGLRPNPQQKITFPTCSRRCIFCDIWRLASLINTHVPLSVRYQASGLNRLQRHDSVYVEIEKRIQSQLQTQRARIASMMSICTVEGADQSEGLYVAFDKCLRSVQDLMYEEAMMEEQLNRPSTSSASNSRRPSEARIAFTEFAATPTMSVAYDPRPKRNAIAA